MTGGFSVVRMTGVWSELPMLGKGLSGTDLTGTLVNWMPAGMVRMSLPCWRLRMGLPPMPPVRTKLPAPKEKNYQERSCSVTQIN